jgi:hypothetical protein
VNKELGRNDICYCGSNKKYKDCHLKPYYPEESFEAEIKEFDSIGFENRAAEFVTVDRSDITVRDPYPWDDDVSTVLRPMIEILWDEKDRWQNRIKRRIDKLHHKLDAMKYHTYFFKEIERTTEENYKNYLAANTTLNKILDNPHLIYNTESFLFQSKSCLDVFAQLVAYSFKFQIRSYGNHGNDLIRILEKEPSRYNPEYAKKVIESIKKNKPWIKELVEMRVEVTHYSDLEELACFLIKKSKENDKIATIYYPSMPDGERVSKYMDKTWNNIRNLMHECAYHLINAAKGITTP